MCTLEWRKNYQELWSIFINGEEWKKVHPTIFGRTPPSLKAPSLKELKNLFDQLEYQRVKRYVLWRLSSQAYHSEHLAKLLKERLVDATLIAKIIEECKGSGYFDDEAWIASFIRNQQKKKGFNHIVAALKIKGLSPESLEHLASYDNQELQKQSIRAIIKNRYRTKDLNNNTERQKIILALSRKGYSFSDIKEVIFQLLEDKYF
jgi:regulatory protein